MNKVKDNNFLTEGLHTVHIQKDSQYSPPDLLTLKKNEKE